MLELREKIGKAENAGAFGTSGESRGSVRGEAILALTSLGYTRAVAEKAVRAAAEEPGAGNLTLELLLKAALRQRGRMSVVTLIFCPRYCTLFNTTSSEFLPRFWRS